MKYTQGTKMTRRLRQAGALIIAGLLVQGASLFWNHALSFILFISLGCLLFGVGALVYLYAIVSNREDNSPEEESASQIRDSHHGSA
jgi:hypothetical protein